MKINLSTAQHIMHAFSARTGLTNDAVAPVRYLWTDAFALLNYLELYRILADDFYLTQAMTLIEQVHATLGQHSRHDHRNGWISGLNALDGANHPTSGGLRIGKKLAERRLAEPYDAHLEWDKDGQYFHYATKWMHALNTAASVLNHAPYQLWALELAKKSHAAFVYNLNNTKIKRMHWKMSIDLSYPLVLSMGAQDPLDGLVTYCSLQISNAQAPNQPAALQLDTQIEEMLLMCEGQQWASLDPLSIGSLLSNAYLLLQLICYASDPLAERLKSVLEVVLKDSANSLDSFTRMNPLDHSDENRLAFREFGLSIGIHALEKMQPFIDAQQSRLSNKKDRRIETSGFEKYFNLSRVIEDYWLDPLHAQSQNWRDHLNINEVMLATSLLANGYLHFNL